MTGGERENPAHFETKRSASGLSGAAGISGGETSEAPEQLSVSVGSDRHADTFSLSR